MPENTGKAVEDTVLGRIFMAGYYRRVNAGSPVRPNKWVLLLWLLTVLFVAGILVYIGLAIEYPVYPAVFIVALMFATFARVQTWTFYGIIQDKEKEIAKRKGRSRR